MKKKDYSNIEFADLIRIEIIQQLQDSFSDATGVASIITKPNGMPITKPSNFCNLCKKIRNTEKGLKNCYNSDAVLGRHNKSGPVYQKCLSSGLWDGGASISIGDRHIANWLIGQVITEEDDEKQILDYAREIGADEEDFKRELKNVTRMPLERFKKIANALFIYANQLSEKAYQNMQLKMHQDYLEELIKEKTEDLITANENLRLTNNELFRSNTTIKKQNIELNDTLKQLKETQIQLLQAEKMASLGTLTAGVSHEINNPLNFIMGSYTGLESYFKEYGSHNNELTTKLLDAMKLGIERTTNIVKGLNQFSRDRGKYDEECNIHSIIDNCLAMLHNKLKDNVLTAKSFSTEEILVVGNVGKLHQVFMNVLANAIYAIEGMGKITIETNRINEIAVIKISDNGIGIEKKHLSQITDPFFTTKPAGEGTGLGLSITYSILKEHNGSIVFESEKNIGTNVTIILPIK
jgi:signal transduction histidine kinase